MMSASGQNPSFRTGYGTSANPLRAEVPHRAGQVGSVPFAEVAGQRQAATSGSNPSATLC